jgi:hypothetical protein
VPTTSDDRHSADDGRGTTYRVIVTGSKQAPGLLSRAGDVPKAEIRYEEVSFSRA